MTIIALAVGMLCAVEPDMMLCVPSFEIDAVIECPITGDANVPLHVNTGTSNPGHGVVIVRDADGELLRLRFESRGSYVASGNEAVVVYTVDPDATGSYGFEHCACHTRASDPQAACASLQGARP